MNVLVIGGAGFIGGHLVRHLVAKRHAVSVLDNFHDDYDPQIKWNNLSALVASDDIELVVGSICDAAVVERALHGRGSRLVDAVVHLASAATAATSLARSTECLDVSVLGASTLLDVMAARQIKRLVVASSSSIYGEVDGLMAEDCRPGRGRSPYAMGKRALEGLGELYADQSGIQVTALRLFSVYGAGLRGDTAISAFHRAISGDQPVTLFGDGSAVRDLVHVDDVVRCMVAALGRTGPAFRAYNVGRGEAVQVRQVADALADALARPVRYACTEARPSDLQTAVATTDRARLELGFTATIDWREGLADLVRTSPPTRAAEN